MLFLYNLFNELIYCLLFKCVLLEIIYLAIFAYINKYLDKSTTIST